MRTNVLWAEKIPGKDNSLTTVYDLCFSPDGSQLLVAVGLRVIVYDASTGDPVHTLRGHRDYCYAITYSKNGKRFASGGADK